MDRRSNADWFPALLTAGSFLAMLSTSIFAFFDALAGSRWSVHELCLAVLCAAAFASLLTTYQPAYSHARDQHERADDFDS